MDLQQSSPGAAGGRRAALSQCGFLVVSEVRFLCEGLAEALARESWIKILGVSLSVAEAISTSLMVKPDFILLDAAVTGGSAAVAEFKQVLPTARVVALAIAETEQDVLAWAQAGVAGYIPRTAGLADLVALLADISNDRQSCSRSITFGLLRRLAHASAATKRDQHRSPPLLTGRELQISTLISAGLSNKEIARRLNIGLSTTKSHVHNMLGKLNIHRRGQVAAWKRNQDRLIDPASAEALRLRD